MRDARRPAFDVFADAGALVPIRPGSALLCRRSRASFEGFAGSFRNSENRATTHRAWQAGWFPAVRRPLRESPSAGVRTIVAAQRRTGRCVHQAASHAIQPRGWLHAAPTRSSMPAPTIWRCRGATDHRRHSSTRHIGCDEHASPPGLPRWPARPIRHSSSVRIERIAPRSIRRRRRRRRQEQTLLASCSRL